MKKVGTELEPTFCFIINYLIRLFPACQKMQARKGKTL